MNPIIIFYDEEPRIQKTEYFYPDLMLVEGHCSTITRDYKSKDIELFRYFGTDSISGRIHYKVFEKHKSWKLIQFLKEFEPIYQKEEIKILMDDYKVKYQWLCRNP